MTEEVPPVGQTPASEKPLKHGMPVKSLAVLRQAAGLSQAELAARSGVSERTIGRLERGANANFSTIGKLAKALGTTRKRLIRPPK